MRLDRKDNLTKSLANRRRRLDTSKEAHRVLKDDIKRRKPIKVNGRPPTNPSGRGMTFYEDEMFGAEESGSRTVLETKLLVNAPEDVSKTRFQCMESTELNEVCFQVVGASRLQSTDHMTSPRETSTS